MGITNRYFEGASGAVRVSIEEEGAIKSVANVHVLQNPSQPETSPPMNGWTEVTVVEYDARIAADEAAAAQAKADAEAARAQAMEDAYNDLVAAGVTAAAATTLTGYSPPS